MQALVLHPTGAGLVFAAAALAAGAPLFSDGLHAVRLRRRLARLRVAALAEVPDGLVHVSGCVALESPLFAPLSGRPCAGFRLEVTSSGHPRPEPIEEWRDFRITEAGASARVAGPSARWDLMVTGWRDVPAGEPLTENLHALLERRPETRWLRESGMSLRLVEHALLAGATCHVVGVAHATAAAAAEPVWLRTGTDDVAVAMDSGAAGDGGPELWLGPGEHDDPMLVSDAPPRPERLRVASLRMCGLVAGPALSLAGMLYLAHAAEWLRAHGGF